MAGTLAKKRSKMVIVREERTSFYLFIIPWIFGFLCLQLTPILWGFIISLTNQTAFSPVIKFVGFKNYAKIIADPDVMYSFYSTFLYTIGNTLIAVFIGFIFALLMEQPVPGRSFFRTMLYFPYMVPLVAVGWIFKIFLERDTGFFNMILVNLGFIESNIPWLQRFPLGSILSLSLWQAGWSMIIFVGALSTVPRELYEVATIDGAGYLRKVRHIMLPMISPFIFFQLVMSFIYAAQEFIRPYIMNPRPIRGSMLTRFPPPKETFFIMARGYYTIVTEHKFAVGLALLWILFAFVLILTVVFVKSGGFWVYTEMDEEEK